MGTLRFRERFAFRFGSDHVANLAQHLNARREEIPITDDNRGKLAPAALSAIAILEEWQGERPRRLVNWATRLEAVTLSLALPLGARKPIFTNRLAKSSQWLRSSASAQQDPFPARRTFEIPVPRAIRVRLRNFVLRLRLMTRDSSGR